MLYTIFNEDENVNNKIKYNVNIYKLMTYIVIISKRLEIRENFAQ